MGITTSALTIHVKNTLKAQQYHHELGRARRSSSSPERFLGLGDHVGLKAGHLRVIWSYSDKSGGALSAILNSMASDAETCTRFYDLVCCPGIFVEFWGYMGKSEKKTGALSYFIVTIVRSPDLVTVMDDQGVGRITADMARARLFTDGTFEDLGRKDYRVHQLVAQIIRRGHDGVSDAGVR